MKNNARRIVVSLTLLLMCAPLTRAVPVKRAQSARTSRAYVDGAAARLSPAHVARLLRLNAPIGVPTLIPAGFRAERVTTRRDTKTSPGVAIIDYTIKYVGPRRKSFSIVSANEGIGDLFLAEQTLSGLNPYFEDGIVVAYLDEDIVDGLPKKTVASQWMKSKRRYEVHRGALASQMYHIVGHGLTPREALSIMESLRYLKK
ncbi:MAG: hypothetical protein WCD76_04735 [Pyrinomonadaceae bacterium]